MNRRVLRDKCPRGGESIVSPVAVIDSGERYEASARQFGDLRSIYFLLEYTLTEGVATDPSTHTLRSFLTRLQMALPNYTLHNSVVLEWGCM